MDFYSPASLGFYSSVSIAASLFYHQDLSYLKKKQRHLDGWVRVQECVAQLVQPLELPKNIEESVRELIQPVGDQIRKWLSKHAFLQRKVDLYNKLSWTSHGMIDYERTAKNLIESKQLDFGEKFTLACLNGVLDYALFVIQDSYTAKIVIQNNELSSDLSSRLMEEYSLMLRHILIERCGNDLLLSKYPFKYDSTDNFYDAAFQRTSRNGNTSLTRHFITKIEPHKKPALVKQQVLNILKFNNRFLNLDTLLFLLSQMEVSEIDKLFVENTELVLLRFLEWPLQRHFMKLANKLWDTMTTPTFNSVLQAIAQHIIQHCSISTNPFGYRDIFREFWLSSPAEYRRVCMNDLIVPILSSLFRSHGYLNAILNLFVDESCLQKLEMLFFSNAGAVLEILANENKAKAFESVIQRYFSPSDIPLDFGEKYSVFTQKYLESYYGEIDIAD